MAPARQANAAPCQNNSSQRASRAGQTWEAQAHKRKPAPKAAKKALLPSPENKVPENIPGMAAAKLAEAWGNHAQPKARQNPAPVSNAPLPPGSKA